jgi:hypothetical protein
MLTGQDKDYIRQNFLTTVKSGKKRSQIMALASVLAEGERDEEDAYLSVLHYFANPKRDAEFKKEYKRIIGGGMTPYRPESDEGKR